MGLQKYESEIKYLNFEQTLVYEKLSDLRNLDNLRQKIADPAAADLLKSNLPPEIKPEQIDKFREYAEKMELGADYIKIASPMGEVTMRLVEQEAPKCIKFGTTTSPLPFNLWIQIVPTGEAECKMKLTIGAEVNMFMKAMVNKPLQKAANGLADMLARLPYNLF